jgi:hypothetical protein
MMYPRKPAAVVKLWTPAAPPAVPSLKVTASPLPPLFGVLEKSPWALPTLYNKPAAFWLKPLSSVQLAASAAIPASKVSIRLPLIRIPAKVPASWLALCRTFWAKPVPATSQVLLT